MFDFDFSNGYVILRIICGFFFLPHAVAKITMREGSIGFFKGAGYPSPGTFVTFGLIFEFIVGPLLILGVFTKIAAWLAFAYLAVATVSVYKLTSKWLWNIGGCEYPLFWAICCAVVALHS